MWTLWLYQMVDSVHSVTTTLSVLKQMQCLPSSVYKLTVRADPCWISVCWARHFNCRVLMCAGNPLWSHFTPQWTAGISRDTTAVAAPLCFLSSVQLPARSTSSLSKSIRYRALSPHVTTRPCCDVSPAQRRLFITFVNSGICVTCWYKQHCCTTCFQ